MNRYLFASQYAAPYKGNFIASLEALEQILQKEQNAQVAYVFPVSAKNQSWIKDFEKQHTTFFTSDDVKHSQNELQKIITEFNPTLIHTHFDGYDAPIALAINGLGGGYKVRLAHA